MKSYWEANTVFVNQDSYLHICHERKIKDRWLLDHQFGFHLVKSYRDASFAGEVKKNPKAVN